MLKSTDITVEIVIFILLTLVALTMYYSVLGPLLFNMYTAPIRTLISFQSLNPHL